MIYLAYLIMAAIVVVLSIKISDYVDSLDRNTKLSGAFLGGILLSGVTSLPELLTSVSATMLLGHPELCVGNVLGSDLFNMTALAVIILAYFKRFTKGRISKSYRHVVLIVFTMYLLLVLNYANIIHFNILHINITSVLMVIVYLLGAKYLAVAEDVEADDEMIQYQARKMAEGKRRPDRILVRFTITAIALVIASILLTVLTNEISDKIELTKTWAGAILLGVATSVPELTTSLRLFKLKNYNIAVGNIVGSNLFNFLILVAADFVTINRQIYMTPGAEVVKLMGCGIAATIAFYIMLRFRNKKTQFVCPACIVLAYAAFLFL
ncbi:MAG: sodium:calcium antiporter [Firmicutes bacterium]|nr:sodium:calcium antiporter [Bacillota bacterium]